MVGLRISGAALVVLAATGCGHVKLDPPPAPAATLPDVSQERPPPPEGETRVMVSTDVPARVSFASRHVFRYRRRLLGEEHSVSADRVVCQVTPCSVRLPHGEYLLLFQAVGNGDRWSTTTLHATEPTQIVNHALGRHEASVAKPIGVASMFVGAALLGMSLFMTRGKVSNLSPQTQAIGLAGAAGIGFGGMLYFASPTYHQEGSTTQWTPAAVGPVGRTYGTGVGLRF